KQLGTDGGRLDLAGPDNLRAGWRNKWLKHMMSIWDPEHIKQNTKDAEAFSWLRFVDQSASEVARAARSGIFDRAVELERQSKRRTFFQQGDYLDAKERYVPAHSMLNIVQHSKSSMIADVSGEGYLSNLMNVSRLAVEETGYSDIEPCSLPTAAAPPIELVCPSQHSIVEKETTFFNTPIRSMLNPITLETEQALLSSKIEPVDYPITNMLPEPINKKQGYTKIEVPSMRRFVTDSGKLAQLDKLLRELKEGGHRVLLYFQMTRMIDLMEEYLTYRNYRYCRLDGSTKLEDRRDTVAAFQSTPEIFVFLLSTRAGGLGINLTSADTVIFYDSDWNPTIDSQAMDRAHRLGQTRQVTVYRLITRGTIEERIRKRALQKEEVQRVVITGGAGA
ncbi:SNF2 family DNA-dependent ATPase domain-containing protein, partial [Aureobasidium melanogenum]